MSKSTLSLEIKNAIVWLERQPGVRSVVQGRYTRSRHHHKPGFTRVSIADPVSVHLRTYDKLGTKDLFVHADASPLRDRWVAALSSGDVLGSNGSGPKLAEVARTITPVTGTAALHVPKPEAMQENAAQVYAVTPDLAAQWLEHNTRNRKLHQRVVNRYAADMRAGRWKVTGDAISFDVNGAIINGQHRIWAVLEAGVTVTMMVAFGLQPDVVSVLDDHLKRNLSDVAQVRRPGTVVNTIHTAIVNMLIQSSIAATAVDRRLAEQRVSRQAQLDMMDRHWDAIEFAFRECFRSHKLRSITVAPVVAPVARAFYTQDKERLREFGRVMLSGMTETADDQAAIVLRNLLLRLGATTGLRATSETMYRKASRALQAFLNREKISTLYEASSELFPLPEDQMTRKGR